MSLVADGLLLLLLLCMLTCPTTLVAAARVRRGVDKRGFTQAEKQKLLDLHNKFRSQEEATDMTAMEWHSGLEQIAQSWADQCVWTHSNNRNHPDFRYIGENLYANTAAPTALDIVKDWNDERTHYNYYTEQCSRVCGHYTQNVWASSYALGCGVRFCPTIQNLNWDRYGGGYVVVCNYGPGGNIVGYKPFTKGRPACAACPEGFPYCVQGLCSKTEDRKPVSSTETLHKSRVSYLILVVMTAYFWFL